MRTPPADSPTPHSLPITIGCLLTVTATPSPTALRFAVTARGISH